MISLNYTSVDTRRYIICTFCACLAATISVDINEVGYYSKDGQIFHIPTWHTDTPFLTVLFFLYFFISSYSAVSAIIQLKSFFSARVRLFSFIAPKALHAWKWEAPWEAPSHPACRLLRHSEIGQLSASPPNLTIETISSQSARSSAIRRDNQSTMGKQKRQSGRKQQGAFKGEYEERGYQKKRRKWMTGREFYLAG